MDRPEIAFILALIGGILALASGLMMSVMSFLMFGFAFAAADMPAMPFSFMGILFGWFVLFQLVGGIAMLVGAPRLRKAESARSGASWALGGGIATTLGGNVLAGALGIVAGAILLMEPAATAAPP